MQLDFTRQILKKIFGMVDIGMIILHGGKFYPGEIMEAEKFILAGKKQRYTVGWRDSGSGILAVLAAVYFLGRHSGISLFRLMVLVALSNSKLCLFINSLFRFASFNVKGRIDPN